MNHIQSPRTDDTAIEQEIVDKGLTAPRITPSAILANIASEHYFTALDGTQSTGGAGVQHHYPPDPSESLALLTFCVLVMSNGFTVTGESACASPENFDADVGRKIARANAMNKIWPLMGYELKQRLHDIKNAKPPAQDDGSGLLPHQQRVVVERAELEDRLDKLSDFLATPIFDSLPEAEQERLVRQSGVMVQLSDVLAERIAAFPA